MLFKFPDASRAADLVLIAIDPASSSKRKMLICAYQCKNWDSKNKPKLAEEVSKAAATVEAIRSRPEFGSFHTTPQFVLVHDQGMACESYEMMGLQMVQISRDIARRRSRNYRNLFNFPTEIL